MPDYTLLHHPISGNPQRLPKCCICSEPVCLETSNTDEYGQALHEECYVLKLCMKKEEWHVLKLWLKADFINDSGIHARPSQIGTRSATFAKRRWHRSASLLYQKAWRGCDMLIQRTKRVFWHPEPWRLELAAVVTGLLLTCWIAYGDGHPDSFLVSLGLHRSTALQDQVLAPPKATTGKGRSRPHTVSGSVEKAGPANLFEQVEDAENEVVHIGSDVTVRYFTTRSIRTPSGSNREVHSRSVGEDVTIRYFTPIVRSIRN
jgi:hypothetical protein